MARRAKASEAEEILRDSGPGVKRFIRSLTKIREDAEDIWQEVCYSFLRHTDEIENVTAWLMRVARNAVINNSVRRHEYPDADDDLSVSRELEEIMFAPDTAPPDIIMLRSLVWDELDDALTELPPEQSEAFRLTVIEGMSVKEIAEQTAVPAATVTSRKYYAVRHLRERLADLYMELLGE